MPKSKFTGTQKKLQKESANKQRDILKGAYAPTTDINALLNEFKQTYKSAGEFLRPQFQGQANQAFNEQNMFQSPEIRNQFGAAGGQGSRSSSLNQALAAARTNLERQLTNDFSQQQMGLAGGIQQMAHQNQANYVNQLAGVGSQGAFLDPYLRSQKGPSMGSQIAGGLIQAGGTALGALAGGPAGMAAGSALGGYFNNQLNKPKTQYANIGGYNQL